MVFVNNMGMVAVMGPGGCWSWDLNVVKDRVWSVAAVSRSDDRNYEESLEKRGLLHDSRDTEELGGRLTIWVPLRSLMYTRICGPYESS